jgi:hypothetical protein
MRLKKFNEMFGGDHQEKLRQERETDLSMIDELIEKLEMVKARLNGEKGAILEDDIKEISNLNNKLNRMANNYSDVNESFNENLFSDSKGRDLHVNAETGESWYGESDSLEGLSLDSLFGVASNRILKGLILLSEEGIVEESTAEWFDYLSDPYETNKKLKELGTPEALEISKSIEEVGKIINLKNKENEK